MRKLDKKNKNKTCFLLKQFDNSQMFVRACLNGKLSIFLPMQSNEIKSQKKQKIILSVAGSLMGLINGFFGGGGGMICVPILQKFLNLNAKQSHATAIMVIFPLSLVSSAVYVYNGFISSYPLIVVSLGVIIGGMIGAFLLKFLPPKVVRIIFAIIMFAGGIKLII